jgi:hypothetical protein
MVGLLAFGFSFVGSQHPTNLWKEPLTSKQKRFNQLFYRFGGAFMILAAAWEIFRK